MIFKEISIKNFRGIQNLTLKDFGIINLFTGKNNSGKTSVLEGIMLTAGMSNPALALSLDNLRNLFHVEADDFQFIFYGLDYKNEPTFAAELFNKETRTLTIHPTMKQASNANTVSTNTSGGQQVSGLVFDFSTKATHSPRDSQKSTVEFDSGGHRMVPPRNYKEKILGIFLTSSTAWHVELPARLEKVFVDKQKDELINILKIIDPNIKDIILGARGGMIYFDVGLPKYLPVNIEGAGTLRLLALVTSIFFNRNGVLCIDEIENGLHYKIFESLWKAMIKAALQFNVQLFVTTHNYEILEQLRLALNDKALAGVHDKVSSYTMIKAKEGIQAVRFSYEQFESAIAEGNEIR
jgi:AAA15 family ATPase/GTPase